MNNLDPESGLFPLIFLMAGIFLKDLSKSHAHCHWTTRFFLSRSILPKYTHTPKPWRSHLHPKTIHGNATEWLNLDENVTKGVMANDKTVTFLNAICNPQYTSFISSRFFLARQQVVDLHRILALRHQETVKKPPLPLHRLTRHDASLLMKMQKGSAQMVAWLSASSSEKNLICPKRSGPM